MDLGWSDCGRAAGGLDQLSDLVSRCFGVATHDPGQRNDAGDDRDGHGSENHEVEPEHGDHAVDLTSLTRPLKKSGARSGVRTLDLGIKSSLLYQLS